MAKIHWSGGSADLRIGCERERGNRFGSIRHRSWPASAFAERAAASPDHYCAHCAKAARLALAAEFAPKADTRSDSDRYAELRQLVEAYQNAKCYEDDEPLKALREWSHH